MRFLKVVLIVVVLFIIGIVTLLLLPSGKQVVNELQGVRMQVIANSFACSSQSRVVSLANTASVLGGAIHLKNAVDAGYCIELYAGQTVYQQHDINNPIRNVPGYPGTLTQIMVPGISGRYWTALGLLK